MIYDAVTDANGLISRTYKDVLGRAVLTVQDPGTPTNASDDVTGRTVHGVDSNAATGVTLPSAAEGWTDVPAGGRHVVKIDAMGRQTHELYDRSGRLTDVWQPGDAKVTSTAMQR